MKKLIPIAILLCLCSVLTVGANWLIKVNPDSFVVTNRTVLVKESVNPAHYAGDNTAVVVESLPPGFDVATWKYWNGTLQALDQADYDAIAATNAAIAAAQQALALSNKIAFAKTFYLSNEEAQERAHRAAIETVIELVTAEINILRAQHGLAARTDAAVKSTFLSTFQSKMDAITE